MMLIMADADNGASILVCYCVVMGCTPSGQRAPDVSITGLFNRHSPQL